MYLKIEANSLLPVHNLDACHLSLEEISYAMKQRI